MIHSTEDWAGILFPDLYKEGFIQTLWNTPDQNCQKNGWTLVSGLISPWYFNIRPLGDSPELFFNCCLAMADLISQHGDTDVIVAVEMAGVNFSGGMAVASKQLLNIPRRIAYTRPLERKLRTPDAAAELLSDIDRGKSNFVNYGQKDFLEGRLREGDKVAIFDDMATNLGSKIIARLIVLWVARQMGISVTCNDIFYFLNRDSSNRQRGLDFANETNPDLYPESLDVQYVIEFDDHFPSLAKVMHPAEFETIKAFQENPDQFYDPKVRQAAIDLAAKTRQR